MEIAEHLYADDPNVGHPDVRTRLADTDYYFLGNGQIQAVVQICHSNEGTPVGLLVMNPDCFGPKRATLTCDAETGLENTMVGLRIGNSTYRPDPSSLKACWEDTEGVPTVRVEWKAGRATVVEHLCCPDRTEMRIARRIEVSFQEPGAEVATLQVGMADPCEATLDPHTNGGATATLNHWIKRSDAGPIVETRWEGENDSAAQAAEFWNGLTRCRTFDADLDHLFSTSRSQMPAAVDHIGRMDGSIWQYNLEWVRDQAHVTEALVRLGDHELCRTMLARLLDEFVSDEGDTVDSGQRRPAADVELDQNGELLAALGTYVDWTGDVELAESRWEKVQALANFPLNDRFKHVPSGLLHNEREYWERHGGHGIEDGFELVSQFFVVIGLEKAAVIADILGHTEDRDQWNAEAILLRHGILEHPRFRLIEDGRFIKRRGIDGAWQRSIHMETGGGLPEAIPLLQEGPHFLDPDTASILPVAHEFIDPKGELAKNTLAHMEELWSQWWDTGGYGRYHASSEADLPGAWPFASIFVARAHVEAGNDDMVWRILRWLRSTPGGESGAWFENDGPRIAPPYAQLGFTPWTWAEMITLFVDHILGVRPNRDGLTIRPKLLDGLDLMEASVRVRGYQLDISVRRAESDEERGGLVGGRWVEWGERGVRLDLPTKDFTIEVLV